MPTARDIAVQIYDNFTIRTFAETSDEVYASTNHLLSACCIVLGAKLHDAHTPITQASFPYLRLDDMIEFEQILLEKIEFNISPQATPSAFVQKFLQLSNTRSEKCLQEDIANSLITDFLEEPESLLFSPSTIAISSLIYSFLHLKVDCSVWLDSLPDSVLPTPNNQSFRDYPQSEKDQLLDVDACLQCFQAVMAKRFAGVESAARQPNENVKVEERSSSHPSTSPTSVVAAAQQFDVSMVPQPKRVCSSGTNSQVNVNGVSV
jgi:hypothetical protein